MGFQNLSQYIFEKFYYQFAYQNRHSSPRNQTNRHKRPNFNPNPNISYHPLPSEFKCVTYKNNISLQKLNGRASNAKGKNFNVSFNVDISWEMNFFNKNTFNVRLR